MQQKCGQREGECARARAWRGFGPRALVRYGASGYDLGMNYWIGTSGFQYPEWKGKFYPEKMPASKMLAYYAERFSSTESNYSFRTIPSAKTIAAWKAGTPPGFRFSFKALQQITHFARLKNCAEKV